MTARTCYGAEIAAAAGTHGLPADLVEALVLVESAGHTDAFRYEPGFFAIYMARNPAWQWAVANPRRYASSYGLMQIMFPVAWEGGFRGDPEELFRPTVGLDLGCRKLASLMAWADHVGPTQPLRVRMHSALAAYNGGKFRNEPDEAEDRNAVYANSVLALVTPLHLA